MNLKKKKAFIFLNYMMMKLQKMKKKLSGKTGPVGKMDETFQVPLLNYFILPEFSRNGKCCTEGVRNIFAIFTLKLKGNIQGIRGKLNLAEGKNAFYQLEKGLGNKQRQCDL